MLSLISLATLITNGNYFYQNYMRLMLFLFVFHLKLNKLNSTSNDFLISNLKKL